MRYNRKSMGMLNRDMLKRDLFFFLILIIPADIAISRMDPSFGGYATMRLFAIIMTSVIVIALVLFLIITKPKRLIPDELIDSAESFEYVIPSDATKRMIEDYAPGLERGHFLICRKGDEGFEKVCEALRSLKGARTKILPDYPRFNLYVNTDGGQEPIGTFYENVTFGDSIYRVREDELEKTFFNPSFTALFHEK